MRLILSICCFLWLTNASAQTVLGKWITIDDNTGEQKSVVEIYEKDGKLFGRIVKLFRKPGEDPDPICEECSKSDERYHKKIIGMNIITDMKKHGNEYSGGEILDPSSGKVYSCKLWLEQDQLQVRGYWGPFFRTQTWKKGS